MKRILAIAFTFTMLLAALTGCVAEDITGTITFYSEATLEKNEPVSETSFELSKEQVKTIKKIIKNVKDWTDDSAVDRLPLYFDGEIKFSDSEFVYYFSYDSRVIYYYHYFSVISDDEMQEIKDINQIPICRKPRRGLPPPIDFGGVETDISDPAAEQWPYLKYDANADYATLMYPDGGQYIAEGSYVKESDKEIIYMKKKHVIFHFLFIERMSTHQIAFLTRFTHRFFVLSQ